MNGELALIVPPPIPTDRELHNKLYEIPWIGAGKQALSLFNQARKVKPADDKFWGTLALKVYDGKFYTEALEAFRCSITFADKGSIWYFTSLVWQGHILDLLGRRDEAIECYKQALQSDINVTIKNMRNTTS